ncbi:hypothetical protein PTTG_00857 [Puccinia triticina 1-1 BBBD Race 1]|uniref:Uncharacterized protein n=2 Tax=Puccinia triticina TaxID=208348 RepID=A0A0C4EJD9_PUCT1|nr:hypothetical protein PTTG_00857 [Puccinia triticina 1-1 BBBD Race 1]
MRWCKLSSFSAIQYVWENTEEKLDTVLTELVQKLQAAIQLQEEEGDLMDDVANPAGALENNAAEPEEGPENHLAGAENNQAELQDDQEDDDEIMEDPEDDDELMEDLSDGGSDGSAEGSVASAPPEEFVLRPRVTELMRLAVPLVKICGVFFFRLWDNPTSKPPFTFSERMHSYDLIWFSSHSGVVGDSVHEICKVLYRIHAADGFDADVEDELDNLNMLINHLRASLDGCIALIGFHLVPSASVPPSEHIYRNYFYATRSEIRVAMDDFSDAVELLIRDAPQVD